MSNTKITPKGGRSRTRRSIVVYNDTATKFKYIANQEGVPMAELLEQVMAQAVSAWEQKNGEIEYEEPQLIVSGINIETAIQSAAANPPLRRGNPHKEKK